MSEQQHCPVSYARMHCTYMYLDSFGIGAFRDQPRPDNCALYTADGMQGLDKRRCRHYLVGYGKSRGFVYFWCTVPQCGSVCIRGCIKLMQS